VGGLYPNTVNKGCVPGVFKFSLGAAGCTESCIRYSPGNHGARRFKAVIDKHRETAIRGQKPVFYAVEIHAAHGYGNK
jgi:hypothetical protein